MTARYLVTGATGLIGKELVLRLLERGEVHVLVRPGSLDRHAAVIERWKDQGHLSVVEGDVTAPDLGIAGATPDYDHVFHLAARYDLLAEPAELEAANVSGTKHLLAWLKGRGFDGVLHHVSSIAVAGDHEGTFREDQLEEGQSFPHAYHRTKWESERLVRRGGLRHRIYRPSAVVGHSITGAMDRIDGPYYLFGPIKKLRDWLPRWLPVFGPEAGPINMVPVDWVAAVIDHLAHAEGLDGRCFHVVDPDPPSFRRTFNLLADAAGASRMKKSRLGSMIGQLGPARDILGQLGSVKLFREALLDDFAIPKAIHAAFNRDVRYDTTELDEALAGAWPCPRQEDYVEALWDHWLRNLDPDRDPKGRIADYLSGRRVLITGGSSGVGEALAMACAQAGARVTIAARREPELRRVQSAIAARGGEADYVVADLSSFDACDTLAQETLARHGGVDVIINNAAHSIRRPLAESLERFHDLERLTQLNYLAPARLIRAVLPGMRERRAGHVVNVLSAGTHIPAPRFGAYSASKSALAQLGDSLAAELYDEGITVTNAYLGWVRTPMMEASGKYEDTQAMSPEAAAEWILEAVARRARRAVTAETTRRFVLHQLVPDTSARLLNVLYRIYADDPDAHPELAFDRTLAKRFIKGRLI
jgi:NAD(P)-dependent dehydrogenase (short-subunit alcohol dehydrogenase family)